jgi:hypothetical protein
MELLWKRTHKRFQRDLENADQLIQCTQEALQLLNELQAEKGVEFVRAWLNREGEIPLLFEYIKYYGRHIPFGIVHEDGSPRLEAILAKELFLRLKEFSYQPQKEIEDFIHTMGYKFLLEYK